MKIELKEELVRLKMFHGIEPFTSSIAKEKGINCTQKELEAMVKKGMLDKLSDEKIEKYNYPRRSYEFSTNGYWRENMIIIDVPFFEIEFNDKGYPCWGESDIWFDSDLWGYYVKKLKEVKKSVTLHISPSWSGYVYIKCSEAKRRNDPKFVEMLYKKYLVEYDTTSLDSNFKEFTDGEVRWIVESNGKKYCKDMKGYTYCSDKTSWENLYGRAGYFVIQGDEVVVFQETSFN